MAINNFNVGVGTTSQLTRYRYVATGGETSVSGSDADGKTLSYTVGLEQVFLNGVNLVRGQDYTATNGTSVGALTALVVSDVVEVFAFVPFNIANALTVSTVDAKGDLLVGTGADAVGRLAVGSTKGQLLSVDSSTASGLAWINPGMTLISTTTIGSTVSSVTLPTNTFTSAYDNYKIFVDFSRTTAVSATTSMVFRLRAAGTDNNSANYSRQGYLSAGASLINNTIGGASEQYIGRWLNVTPTRFMVIIEMFGAPLATETKYVIKTVGMDGGTNEGLGLHGFHSVATAYDSMNFIVSSGTISNGRIMVYGYNQ